MANPIVSIIMGSDSDMPVMQEAAKILESFGVPFEITIVSAHRTPKRLYEFAESAHNRGIEVVKVGDCHKVADISYATKTAYDAANAL